MQAVSSGRVRGWTLKLIIEVMDLWDADRGLSPVLPGGTLDAGESALTLRVRFLHLKMWQIGVLSKQFHASCVRESFLYMN